MRTTHQAWAEADRRRDQLHLWVALALLLVLILLWLFGRGPATAGCCAAPVVTAPAATAVTPIPTADLYFELDKFDLPADASTKLAPIIAYLKANASAKAIISGYHDPTGSPADNEELAESRAKAARGALITAGIAEERVVLQKPQDATGTGTHEQARRASIRVQP